MRKLFASHLLSKALEDSRIVLVTGDLGFGVLDEFAEKLPNQYLNTGITEQASMSLCAGLASEGFRPFYYSIGNFPTFRCLEQIRLDVSYMRNPVTIVSVGAGFAYSTHGYTHHAVEDIAAIRSLSQIQIFSPTYSETIALSLDQIIQSNSPAYLRLGTEIPESIHAAIDEHNKQTVDAEVILFFTGSLAAKALEIIRQLALLGIRTKVLDIFKLSEDVIHQVLNIYSGVRMFVTLEEHSLNGGLGTAVIEVINKFGLDVPLIKFGLEKPSIEIALPREEMLDHSGLRVFDLIQRISAKLGI